MTISLLTRNRYTRSRAHQLCSSERLHEWPPNDVFPSTAFHAYLSRYVVGCMAGFCPATSLSGTLAFAVETKDRRSNDGQTFSKKLARLSDVLFVNRLVYAQADLRPKPNIYFGLFAPSLGFLFFLSFHPYFFCRVRKSLPNSGDQLNAQWLLKCRLIALFKHTF